MKDIMKIDKFLQDTGLLIKGVKQLKINQKNKTEDFSKSY